MVRLMVSWGIGASTQRDVSGSIPRAGSILTVLE